MASAFDPSAFIEAERQARTIATVANAREACDSDPAAKKWQNSAVPDASEPEESQQSQQSQPSELNSSIWVTGPRLLAEMPRPLDIEKSKWDHIVRTAKWITDDWAIPAREAGWTELEFFGTKGLIQAVLQMRTPMEIIGVSPEHADLSDKRGSVLRKYRWAANSTRFLWEAYGLKGGP